MKPTTAVSHEEYFKILKDSTEKLEYHNGEIVAMAGAQPRHVRIQSNIQGFLFKCLKAKGCSILGVICS